MKTKSICTLLCVGALMLAGCHERDDIQTAENKSEEWKKTEAVLLDKQMHLSPCKAKGYSVTTVQLYFDTDKNPETAEEMLIFVDSSKQTSLNVQNNAKIGESKPLGEWNKIIPADAQYKEWISNAKKQNTR
jgi:hypothetical protein